MNKAVSDREAAPSGGPAASDLSAPPPPVPALIAALGARQVRYCHWKSNIRLADSLAGDEDLDLLVRRSDAGPFFAALAEAGFKLAEARRGGGHPGVLHAFALDPHSLRLVHVHAYFQVVTGDSLVKSYRLPFEDLLLDGARREAGVPTPAPEAELVVFLLRIALKHTGPVEALLVNRRYACVPEELLWLRARADEARARALWSASVPGAADGEFDALMRAVADPSAVARRIRFGLRLGWRLRDWRRLGYAAAFVSRLRRLALLAWCRLRRRRPLRLVAGGAIVALVGPKASGKSTLGAALGDRLGKPLDVRRIHVGKPPATLLSTPVRAFLPLLRRVLPGERSGEYEKPERRADMRYSFAYILRMLLLAHDRRALLLRSRRAATQGAILIADRYPSVDVGAIDSSQFSDAAVAACTSRWKRLLMRLERGFYRDLPKPDLVIRLVAPIETTLLRDATRSKREGPDPESLQRRRDMETTAKFPGVPVLAVSSDRELDQTVGEVVRGVWRHL